MDYNNRISSIIKMKEELTQQAIDEIVDNVDITDEDCE